MSGRLIKARFLACPTASAQDRIPDRRRAGITQNAPILRIRHAILGFLLSSAPKFPSAARNLSQTFGSNRVDPDLFGSDSARQIKSPMLSHMWMI